MKATLPMQGGGTDMKPDPRPFQDGCGCLSPYRQPLLTAPQWLGQPIGVHGERGNKPLAMAVETLTGKDGFTSPVTGTCSRRRGGGRPN